MKHLRDIVPINEAVNDKEGNPIVDYHGKPVLPEKDGKITLFHRTSPENAQKIKQSGNWLSKESTQEVFFSNKLDGHAESYGDGVVKTKIHPKHLRMTDAFPSGEIYFAVHKKHLNKSNLTESIDDIRYNAKKVDLPTFISTHSVQAPSNADKNWKPNNESPHDEISLDHLDPSELDVWDDADKEFNSNGIDHVERLRNKIRNNEKIHPVLVRGEKDNKIWRPQVQDGHHRVVAFRKERKSSIPVWYDDRTLENIWKKENAK